MTTGRVSVLHSAVRIILMRSPAITLPLKTEMAQGVEGCGKGGTKEGVSFYDVAVGLTAVNRKAEEIEKWLCTGRHCFDLV